MMEARDQQVVEQLERGLRIFERMAADLHLLKKDFRVAGSQATPQSLIAAQISAAGSPRQSQLARSRRRLRRGMMFSR
jgi:hypothetical protein